MLKKLAGATAVFMMAVVFVFSPAAYADTEYGPASWRTEDGKYELTFTTTTSENDVQVSVWDLYKVHKTSGAQSSTNADSLQVRLCNTSTGNCTAYKTFYVENHLPPIYYYQIFTNMKPGTYYVDIRDNLADYYVKGKVSAWTNNYY
ncbi:hypothetical protein [Staphylospora marina]|uniref:hypothetical protein n=1 Tax=Staphylospora marina TaxID=2490858 RepID=UPI000F5BD9E5|nr:hypothetical protein [Staphylospora marina]